MNRFMKISENQLKNDSLKYVGKELHAEDIKLPVRATAGSAGYDFFTPVDFTVKAHSQSGLIPTGIRCMISHGVVLLLFVRSSIGIKKQCVLSNGTGVIDEDYFNADNEGHIMFSLRNNSDEDISFKAGDRIMQGIFVPYIVAEDNNTVTERTGGFGSTD